MKHRPKEERLYKVGVCGGWAFVMYGGFDHREYVNRFPEEDRPFVEEGFNEGRRIADRELARAS